jgi:hypothetical protein
MWVWVRFPSPAPIEFWSHVEVVLTGDVEIEKTGPGGRFFCGRNWVVRLLSDQAEICLVLKVCKF